MQRYMMMCTLCEKIMDIKDAVLERYETALRTQTGTSVH
jgi:hypothetical protein